MEARVQVHASFTVPAPIPLYVIAVETIAGNLAAGMFVHIPLNPMVAFTVRICEVRPVRNSWGLSLSGLVLRCEDESGRQLIDAFGIGDELLVVHDTGED